MNVYLQKFVGDGSGGGGGGGQEADFEKFSKASTWLLPSGVSDI